jgi:hypothetical protein
LSPFPSCWVTFSGGTTVLGTAPLSAGIATFTTAALGVGAQAIIVSYGGDGSQFGASISGIVP